MDYGVDFMVKKQKTLQRFWKYAVESIMNIAVICLDVGMVRSDIYHIFNSFAATHLIQPHEVSLWLETMGGGT